MEAKELMISDWVQIAEPCKYAGAIGRIKTLIDHKDEENAYFKVFLQNNTIHIDIEDICSEDIRPIPLTPEILEKNGFSHNEIWHNSYVDIENYHIDVQFGYGGKVDNIRIRENGKDSVIPSEKTNLYLAHIEYLHELQHAMKLCGIEKEIEL